MASYVSPRKRAQKTLELLGITVKCNAKVEITDQIREWDYGDYEGLTSKTIREQRAERGEGSWDIWRDGCPGGE